MFKVTALIPTFNEEVNLRECLESVKWADEIFVIDSFSSDRTVDIAREYNARIVQHEYVNSATQKNWAIPQASNEWILLVDADERVTPELRGEIEALLREGPEHDGYIIHRRSFFFGKEIKHCGWNRDTVIRFFHRDRCRYQKLSVHAEIEMQSPPGRLQGLLTHFTYRSFDQYFEKFGRYTTWSAEDLYHRGCRPSFNNLCLRPMFRFFKMYVLQRGYLDGREGFILCGLYAFYVFVKYAKLWYIYQSKKNPAIMNRMSWSSESNSP